MTSRHELRDLHHHWVRSNGVFARNPDGTHSVNIILSMQPGTPPDRVEAASRRWARESFADRHDWLMVRHDDSQHPYVHVTVRAVGSDGRRLAPGPEHLQLWRERFARELRRLGVAAEATPRQARGIVVRHASTPVHRITQRGAVSTVSARLFREARSDVERQAPPTVAYWSQIIQRRQASIRAAYLQHAEALLTGEADERQLGRDIQRFVAALSVPLPRRQASALALTVAERRRAAATSAGRDVAAERVAPASPHLRAMPPAPKPAPR